MKVYKVNKAEMIKVVILLILIIGLTIAVLILDNDFLRGFYGGIYSIFLLRFFGLFPEKPAIESVEIEEKENEIE